MTISAQSAPAEEEHLYHETMQALDAPETSLSAYRKAGLLAGTFALSVLAFLWLGYSLLFLLILVSVLLFHELGHYLGMRLFGYRDVRMFFIPFFGAAVSGRKYGVPVWQEATVLLLGPLPGLALAVALNWIYEPRPGGELATVVAVLAFLNAFNLLPVMPLDGGRLVNLLFFARQPYLAAGFQLLAGCALAAYAWGTSSWVLGFLGVMLLLGVSSTYREAKQGIQLRAENLSLPDRIEQLDEAQRRVLFARALQRLPQDQRTSTSLAGQVRAVYEHMMARRPSLSVTVLFVALYLSGFAACAAVLYAEGPLTAADAADDRGLSASLGGKYDEALAEYRKALAIREAYLAKHPDRAEAHYAISVSYAALAIHNQAVRGPAAKSLEHLEKALSIRQKLVEREPSVQEWHLHLSRAHRELAEFHKVSQPEQALEQIGRAITAQETAITKGRHSWYDKHSLADLHRDAGGLVLRMARPHEAVKHYRASLSIYEGITQRKVPASAHEALGDALAVAGERTEAVDHLRKAVSLYGEEIATGSSGIRFLQILGLSRVVHSLAPILLELGREAEALDAFRTLLAVQEKDALDTQKTEMSEKAGQAGQRTGWALARVSKAALFARDFVKALSAAERSLSLAPGQHWAEANRAHALLLLGRVDEAKAAYLAHKGQKTDTDKTWEQAVSEGFASLRRAGLDHPMMPEIDKLLGAGKGNQP